jgi:hypothetical protein
MTRHNPSADVIELGPHDVTRIWYLAVAIYDGDDPDADLRECFVQAMKIYRDFTRDLESGGNDFEEGGRTWVSERELGPDGDIVRFRAKGPAKKAAPKVRGAGRPTRGKGR